MNEQTHKGNGSRAECITDGAGEAHYVIGQGISVREFASARRGAFGFSTGIARFPPLAELPYHVHACGESVTILTGRARVLVEGRSYSLIPFDSIHIPANVPHAVQNPDKVGEMVAHAAFSEAEVTLTPANGEFRTEDRDHLLPRPDDPESLLRFQQAPEYELSENAFFRDLFASRLGSRGICGGYGRFAPGASLPCHTHKYDESITIVEGAATCLVAGRRHNLSGYATAMVPQGLPHRFINQTDEYMAMLWVYAGDEPERVIVEDSLCSSGMSC
jgi:quercetin dioxygenase-like cupin family protein